MKHLVIDARAAQPYVDGLGTYLRQIVPPIVASPDLRTTLLVHAPMLSDWRRMLPSATIVASDCRPMRIRQNWEIPRLLAKIEPDLYFYPAHDPPALLRTPYVFTIHDLTPHLVRPYFERVDALKTGYLRVATGHALRGAAAVFAVSEATRSAIGELFGAAAREKTVVTLNGVAPAPAEPEGAAGAQEDLGFLCLGNDRPHKNLPRVVDAYAAAARQRPELPRLHIVGGLRSERQLREQIRRHGLTERVVIHGHVDDAVVEERYRRSVALLIPSLAEGFGIPIIEAMARGVPVLTSRTSACVEVAGGAALLVDPWDVTDITRGLLRIEADTALRSDLVRMGRVRAAQFSWERCAKETLGVIRRVLAELPSGGGTARASSRAAG